MASIDRPAPSFAASFCLLLGCFSLLLLLSWPIVFSFDYWVLKDRGSFLNLDYLLEKHYLLGVDVCYSYGLLPVFLQHLVFKAFGRGYQPMLGCTLIILVILAFFWTLLIKQIPRRGNWLIAVALLAPALILVNPNFPYSVAMLSMLFALLLVLKERLDLALAVSAIGPFCVPSLPLVLVFLLALAILATWWFNSDRKPATLARQLAPGILSYVALAFGLGLFFGFKSMLATALPINGAKYYGSAGLNSLTGSLQYFHPPGYSLKYYLAYYSLSPVTWFAASLILLTIVGFKVFAQMFRQRHVEHRGTFVLLCAALIWVFLLFAYGPRGEQLVYQPILAAGTLIAIGLIPGEKLRNTVLGVLLALAVLGDANQAYKTIVLWRTTRPAPDSLGLYVDPGFATEWSSILQTSKKQKLVMLSYGTGEHHYFPTIKDPDVWFLVPGLLFPGDMQRILDQISQADVVVEDRTGPSTLVDWDSSIRSRLNLLCETSDTQNFRIWQRCKTGQVASK